jgi:hypothetical protein
MAKREQKTLAGTTDKVFRRFVRIKYKFDPLPDQQPKTKPVPVYTGTNELIEKYTNDDWVEIRAVLRELAITKLAHMTFGEGSPNAAIRFELIDIIASKLALLLKGQRKATKKRHSSARAKHELLKAYKAQILQNHPSFSDSRIATLISKEHGGNPNTIRRVIAQK